MDHDRLFKELLATFFVDFIDLFFPELAAYLAPDSLVFLDKELFTDLVHGERHEADLVVQAQFRDQPLCFLIHVETQAQPQAHFARRMFTYFARLHEKHDLPVYPVAVFSYATPQREEQDVYRVEFPDLSVLRFQFRVVQLNQLDWRNFVDRASPVVAALMARMRMEPWDQPRVKLACLRMLAQLQLDPARRALISGFVDSYLRLTMEQESEFARELNQIANQERERVMEIVTSWMEKGLEEGLEKGLEKERRLVSRQLRKRLGELNPEVAGRIDTLSAEQLEELGEALLEFERLKDLTAWLAANVPQDLLNPAQSDGT
jgi:hypothetical protein